MNLNQITLPSIDLSISIPFYQQLGLNLIVHTSNDYARFECPDGDSTFSLHRVDNLPSGDGIYVYFEIEDLDEYINQLIKKGISIDEMPVDQSWGWRECRLKDPDGNRLILFFAGEFRKNPPWKLR